MAFVRQAAKAAVVRRPSGLFAVVARHAHKYTTSFVGASGTADTRIVFRDHNHAVISPWHDIPLRPAGYEKDPAIFNFVNEIPKGARAKMEIATKEAHNPIKQDVKKGNLRFYHFDSLVNYGCIPQTWEDPEHVDESTRYGGDNDPIDVVEISSRVAETGEVYPVKVLGVLGMIDEDETDWKVIAIDVKDPLADKLHDLNDLLLNLPEVVPSVRTWFRDYKIPDGKPPSTFAFDGKAMDKAFAIQVIEQTHASWKRLNDQQHKSDLWTLASKSS
ncbi:inorganic pyrophosphatase [Achlya hypogyna]|uniref:inorganic diphosphatase n=1 Tax=Achlya hypogyna TaxID=1202772 RepID=A0A1V9ZFV6_ACHHY|nr:inorganic pyrophosphatase [Achlya hypogyna]